VDSKDPSPITVVSFEAPDVESGVREGETCSCAVRDNTGVNGGNGDIGEFGCFLSVILD